MSPKETYIENSHTFYKNDRLYHSKRNPQKEAQLQLEQFFTTVPHGSKLVFIAINPGLGFIRGEASQYFSRVFCLYTPGWGYEKLPEFQDDDLLFPSLRELIDWFKNLHPSFLLYKPCIFYHPRFLQFDRDSAKVLEVGIQQMLTQKKQELLTRGFFSYKYKKNILRFLITMSQKAKNVCSGLENVEHLIKKPVLLLVSGPSLNQYEKFLRHRSHEFHIMALPSSLAYLGKIQIQPDSVISTDPGYWAGLHLRFLSSFPHPSQIYLYQGLTSEVLSQQEYKSANQVPKQMYFSQSTMIEQCITSQISKGNQLLELPEAATVSASAVELLVRSTEQPIIILGLDLEDFEGLSHVHPHPFDSFFLSKTQRTNTFEHQHWFKISQNNSSLEYYRQWFKNNLEKWGSRVYLGSHNRFKIQSHIVDVEHLKSDNQVQNTMDLSQKKRKTLRSFTTNDTLISMAKNFSQDPFLVFESNQYQDLLDLFLQLDYFKLKMFLDSWSKNTTSDIPATIIANCIQEFAPHLNGL